MISIDQIETAEQIESVRILVGEFTDFALTLNPEALNAPSFAGLEEQLADLPGIFSPPSGAFLLATVDGAPAGCVAYFDHGEDAFDLLLAQNLWHPVRLPKIEYLGHQIMSPQCHPEQKLHPRHGPIAVADAYATLNQMMLEIFHIVRCCRIGGSSEPSCEPFTAPQVVDLGCLTQIPCSHIRNHAVAKGRRGSLCLNIHR